MTRIQQLAAMLAELEAVDLTHTLEEGMPVYPTHSRYYHGLWDSQETGSAALSYQLTIHEHCGTHMDATAHFMPAGHPAHRFMADTPIGQFYARALTIDCGGFADNELVTRERIERWESEYTAIRAGDAVLFRFGWDRYWKPRAERPTYTVSWPGLSGEAAVYLADKRIKAVGCDTLAIDCSDSRDNPAHHALLGNGINIIENLTRLERILGESLLFAMPLKIKEGSGSPIRAIAFVEKPAQA